MNKCNFPCSAKNIHFDCSDRCCDDCEYRCISCQCDVCPYDVMEQTERFPFCYSGGDIEQAERTALMVAEKFQIKEGKAQ